MTDTQPTLWTALLAAQAAMGPVIKGSVNPAFKSRYADLAAVYGVALPALHAAGLVLTHYLTDDGRVLVSQLTHAADGEFTICAVPLIVNKNDMQGMKSAITYAKRIGTESLCAIAPEDDDGEAAAKAPPVKAALPPQPMNVSQMFQLKAIIADLMVDEDKLCEHYNVDILDELNTNQYAHAMRKLEARRHERQMNDASHEGEA